jgi:thiol:disulfide interchange protein DsbA
VLFPWIASQGIDRANFEQAYDSTVITDQIQRANQTQNAYMVESTPSLGIAGRFYVDPSYANASADEAQAFASMLKITNTLIAQARKGA